jgi:Predicted peptidase
MKKNTVFRLFVLFTILIVAISAGFGIFTCLRTKSNMELQQLIHAAPDFVPRVYCERTGRKLNYRILEPFQLKANQKYPLVIFLGGTLERGSNNLSQLKYVGPFFERPDCRSRYPCFVVVPQCPAKKNWVSHENDFGTTPLATKPAEPLRLTIRLTLSLRNNPAIDSKRIYILGISSGGSGVWDLLARYPKMFAAAVPFAGSGDATKVRRLLNVPIWIFHGAWDLAVSPNCSRLMYRALKKAGGSPRYTEYPMTGHSCWIKTFQDPQFLPWLFSQYNKS